jgi:hypothetical protein
LHNAISNLRSDPLTPDPGTLSVNIVQQKMTSPLGSAFSTVQPHMITKSWPIQTADGNSKRKWTLDDQADYLSQQQQMAGLYCYAFENCRLYPTPIKQSSNVFATPWEMAGKEQMGKSQSPRMASSP